MLDMKMVTAPMNSDRYPATHFGILGSLYGALRYSHFVAD